MAEKSGMIFGNVLSPGSGKFGRDLVGEWRPPARYVAAAAGGGMLHESSSTSSRLHAMLGVTEMYQM